MFSTGKLFKPIFAGLGLLFLVLVCVPLVLALIADR